MAVIDGASEESRDVIIVGVQYTPRARFVVASGFKEISWSSRIESE